MNKAREYANLWHKSEEGREWHKEHYKKSLEEHQNKKIKKKCECEYSVNKYHAKEHCSKKCADKHGKRGHYVRRFIQ